MAATPTTDADAYQSLQDIRERIDYDGTELYSDNAQLRFDQLLVRLERESRGIFETLWGDVFPGDETRTETMRTTDDAGMMLEYPVQEVSQVEYKKATGSDWETLNPDWYDETKHRLVLARARPEQRHRRGNPATTLSNRATWADLAVKIRVTYDRGFDPIPADIKSVQVTMIERMVRSLRNEQNVAATDPTELAEASADLDNVVTEDIRERIDDVTLPGGATLSI